MTDPTAPPDPAPAAPRHSPLALPREPSHHEPAHHDPAHHEPSNHEPSHSSSPRPPLRPQIPRTRQLTRFLLPRAAQHNVSRAREVWLVLVYTGRRWLQIDRSMTLASSLALQTLLSIVPFAGVPAQTSASAAAP